MQPASKTIIDTQVIDESDNPKASGEKRLVASKFSQLQLGDEDKPAQPAREIGGPAGLEPTRYGDWQINGRCSDF
ncbi:MAG: DUF1674 domain-containing protein [Xanthomonadales bacterium]|nr:DUF1674 domain-containing protein [Xanthomonadales bacterium]